MPVATAVALSSTAVSLASCPADLDGDGWVSGPDLSLVLGNWTGSGVGDLDGDGFVGGGDRKSVV